MRKQLQQTVNCVEITDKAWIDFAMKVQKIPTNKVFVLAWLKKKCKPKK